MNEPESNPALSTGRGFCLWPTIAMLALSFVHWLLLYHFVAHFLLVLAGFFFSAACLVCSLVLVVLRKPKKALSFLIPVLLGVAIGPVPVPVRIVGHIIAPIRAVCDHSRDRVEFLIYDARHHIKAEVRQNGYKYKKWDLFESFTTDYYIVYDVTDAVVRRNGVREGICTDWVNRVDGHFYFLRVEYPGTLKDIPPWPTLGS